MTALPSIGPGHPLALIAGPCVIESEGHVHFLAREIAQIAGPFIFKASFDKANRSSAGSYRGPGLKEGLRILAGIRQAGFPVLTDIHEPAQAALAAEAVDVLQIPAFLCRQTDLLMEAGRTGKAVNIKKGQFVSPYDIRHAADKVASTGNNNILLTERGTTFGYNNLVVDMRGLAIMREFGWPVVFDATHSVQLPGACRKRLFRSAAIHRAAGSRRRRGRSRLLFSSKSTKRRNARCRTARMPCGSISSVLYGRRSGVFTKPPGNKNRDQSVARLRLHEVEQIRGAPDAILV